MTARQGLAVHAGLFMSAACVLLLVNLWRDPLHLWFWRPLLVWAVILTSHAAAQIVRAVRPLVADAASRTAPVSSNISSTTAAIDWRDAVRSATVMIQRVATNAGRIVRISSARARHDGQAFVADLNLGARARLAGRWLRGDDLTSRPAPTAPPTVESVDRTPQLVTSESDSWTNASWPSTHPPAATVATEVHPVSGGSVSHSSESAAAHDDSEDLPDGWAVARAWMVTGQTSYGQTGSPWAPPLTSPAETLEEKPVTSDATPVHEDTVVDGSRSRPPRLAHASTSKDEEWAWLEAAAEAWLATRTESPPPATPPFAGEPDSVAAVS